MALTASKTSRPEAPEGQYAARAIDVYDAGWWKKMDSDEHVQKCKVVFVLDCVDEESGKPFLIDLFETLSLGDKANLRKHLRSWRGKDFTPDQLKGFDIETLLDAPALVQVVHKTNASGELRARVETIMKLPKGMQAPEAPSWYVKDCDRDEPFAAKHPRPKAKAAAARGGDDEMPGGLRDEDDDLPF